MREDTRPSRAYIILNGAKYGIISDKYGTLLINRQTDETEYWPNASLVDVGTWLLERYQQGKRLVQRGVHHR